MQIVVIFGFLSMFMPAQAARRALVVGISAYPSWRDKGMAWHAIHGADDAKAMRALLRRKGFSVAMLTDRQATAAAIRGSLRKLATQTRSGDLVYIHFSCHGQPVEDTDGDETDGWDEAIVPYDAGRRYVKGVYEGRNHIIDDELNRLVSAIRRKAGRCGFVYVVVDACHSGGISKLDADTAIVRGTADGFSPHGKLYVPKIDTRLTIPLPSLKDGAGACYIEACRPYQTNIEIRTPQGWRGSLSYYIERVLAHERLGNDTSWTGRVGVKMRQDQRLSKQNMVTEKSMP